MGCCDALRRDHREVLEVADAATGMAATLVQGRRIPTEDVATLVGYTRTFIDQVHHRREEEVLFPVVRARLPHLGFEIERLVADHRRGKELMEAADAAKADLVRQGELLAAWARLVRAHTAEEEAYLLPIVERSLSTEACLRVKSGFARMERPGRGRAAELMLARYLVGV